MYKEVAIDPACMAEFEYYTLLKREFGFEKGRYAAVDIKPWAHAAVDIVKKSEIQPIKKRSVISFLNRVQKRREESKFLLSRDREKIREPSSWNSWWQAQNNYRPFDVSISEASPEQCINHNAILEDCESWRVPPSIAVPRRHGRDIVAALEPLIRLSKHLWLIDQYFELEGNNTLTELTNFLNNSSVTKLTIVSSRQLTADPQSTYESRYGTLSNIHFKWIAVPERYFHDRYFITDVGAVGAGHGFSSGSPQGSAHSDLLELSLKSAAESERAKQSLDAILSRGSAKVLIDILRA